MLRRVLAILVVLASGSAALIGCGEMATSARLETGPKVLLDGGGRLAALRVYGPRPGKKIATPFDARSLVWDIEPTAGYFKGALVHGLVLEIGKVPRGYTQELPSDSAIVQLRSHVVYYFLAETAGAAPADGFFYLDGNVPVEINVPGLCESGTTGDVRPIKCGTNDPYAEPEHLEQFVQQNRIKK